MKYLKMFAELTIGKIIIFAALTTVLYYTSYFDPGTSIETEITNLKGQVDQLETRRVEITKTMKKEEEMRGNTLQLKRNLEVVKSKIPNELKDTQMQSIINDAANSSGVTIVSLSVADQRPRNTNPLPTRISIEDVKPENLIEEVKFSINIHGTFDSFIKFLDFLAKEDKVIKIRNFTIDQLTKTVDEDKITFTGEIIGFKQANIEIIPRSK